MLSLLFAAAMGMITLGPAMVADLYRIASQGFSVDRALAFDTEQLPGAPAVPADRGRGCPGAVPGSDGGRRVRRSAGHGGLVLQPRDDGLQAGRSSTR
jgi:hypothetical protein